jgi:uncharacterized membrane protein
VISNYFFGGITKNQNSVFRANARAQLGGNIFANNWLMALVVCLIQSLILGIGSSLAGVVAILVGGLLAFGLARVFLQLVRGQKDKVDIADLFCVTDEFGSLIVLNLLVGLFTFLWTLLFIIPGIVKSYAYSMAFYIKHDHPEYDWKQCMDESQRYMSGHKWQLFCLDFSFIGWILLGALCCGIGTLWVTPYQYAARANFYENLKALYDPEVEIPEEESFDATAAEDTESV